MIIVQECMCEHFQHDLGRFLFVCDGLHSDMNTITSFVFTHIYIEMKCIYKSEF